MPFLVVPWMSDYVLVDRCPLALVALADFPSFALSTTIIAISALVNLFV